MYILHFDIAASVIMLFMLPVYFSRRRMLRRGTAIFGVFMIVLFASSILSFASSAIINTLCVSCVGDAWLINTFYYLFHNSLPPIMTLYLASIIYPSGLSRAFKATILSLWTLSVVLIMSNVSTGLVFDFDDMLNYHHGPLLPVLYAIACLHIFIAIGAIMINADRLGRRRTVIFTFALIIPLLGAAIQNAVGGLMLEAFGASLSMLFVFLTVQHVREAEDRRGTLPSRAFVMEKIQELLAARKGFTALILHTHSFPRLRTFLDPASFERISRQYTSWLKDQLGRHMYAGAFGEGIHMLILEAVPGIPDAGELALRIVRRSQSPWEVGELSVLTPLHVLLVRVPKECSSLDELSDLVMQFSRIEDRTEGRHIFFPKDFVAGRHRRDALMAIRLGNDITHRRLEPRFQTLVSVQDDRVDTLEVLCEMDDDKGTLLRQGETLRIAKEAGLSVSLFDCMLETCLERYHSQKMENLGIRSLQLRLPEAKILLPSWYEGILKALKEARFPPSRLCLAITETTVATVCEELAAGMEVLGGAGVTFALDDFGSGYTDLDAIFSLNFEIIKMDKDFTRVGLTSKKGRQLLAGSIALFRDLNRSVVAEGIENLDAAQALTLMGANYLQGYFFSRPVPARELADLISSGHPSPRIPDRE